MFEGTKTQPDLFGGKEWPASHTGPAPRPKAIIEVEKGLRDYKIILSPDNFPHFTKVLIEAFEAKGMDVEFRINEDFIP